MGLLARAANALGILTESEGAVREGPYFLPTTGEWLSAEAGSYMNWWQLGYSTQPNASSSIIHACISSYAETVAMCPGSHWKWTPEEGRKRVTTSALVRILKNPNDYQSISDFLMNLTGNLFYEGNAYALVIRNNRFEPAELHLMDSRKCAPRIAETGEIFYHLQGNPIVDARFGDHIIVPARDVLHIRLRTPRHPLIGETPLAAAALEITSGNAILHQQVRFMLNQARPSFILSTDAILTKEQADMLRESWNAQANGLNRGGTPILSGGLKPQVLQGKSNDAELSTFLKMSDQSVARAFRVPFSILGIADGPSGASTEQMIQLWKSGGLGFVLNHIEEAIGNLFKLAGQPDEYLEFDTSALDRSDFKSRVEAWVSGVKGGIFDRNAARADFELPPVEYGDEPWVQAQDIPLSVAGENALNPPEPPPPALPAPEPEPPVDGPDVPDQEETARAFAALYKERMREALRV